MNLIKILTTRLLSLLKVQNELFFSRFVKNDDLYIIDVNIDKLSFEELDETVSEIENLGVKSITFVTND